MFRSFSIYSPIAVPLKIYSYYTDLSYVILFMKQLKLDMITYYNFKILSGVIIEL